MRGTDNTFRSMCNSVWNSGALIATEVEHARIGAFFFGIVERSEHVRFALRTTTNATRH